MNNLIHAGSTRGVCRERNDCYEVRQRHYEVNRACDYMIIWLRAAELLASANLLRLTGQCASKGLAMAQLSAIV